VASARRLSGVTQELGQIGAREGGMEIDMAARKDSREQEEQQHERQEPDKQERSIDTNNKSAISVLSRAKAQLQELSGRFPETVSAFSRTDEGWEMTVEVVELSRIPTSTDVLASYEAELDSDGNVLEYRRVRRYFRNRPDEQGE
jgi:hypothetical protein